MRSQIHDCTTGLGLPADDADLFVLTIYEAIVNAVLHGGGEAAVGLTTGRLII